MSPLSLQPGQHAGRATTPCRVCAAALGTGGWRGVGKPWPCPRGPSEQGGGGQWANPGPAPQDPSEQGGGGGWVNPGPAPRDPSEQGGGVGWANPSPCPPGPLGTGGGGGWANPGPALWGPSEQGGGGGPAPQAARPPASPLPLDLGLPVCRADTLPCWGRCGEGCGP